MDVESPDWPHGAPSMAEALDLVLAPSFTSAVVRSTLTRARNDRAASLPSEVIRCSLVDGTRLELLCKHNLESTARYWAPINALCGFPPAYGSVEYEAQIYDFLACAGCAPVRCYGFYKDVDPSKNFLLIQYLNGATTADVLHSLVEQTATLADAARWIGGFHSAVAGGLTMASPQLARFSSAYYWYWADKTADAAQRFGFTDSWLNDAYHGYRAAVELLGSDATLIHGDFYVDNVLSWQEGVHPIDWALAAIGPGELDLAMLTNYWPEPMQTICERAYAEARWPGGAPERFNRTLAAARLYLAFRLLWKGSGWCRAGSTGDELEMLRSAARAFAEMGNGDIRGIQGQPSKVEGLAQR